jgi:hypothetical protein
MSFHFSLSVDYIIKLSISSLYSEDDRMTNEYGAVGKMRIGKEGQSAGRKSASVS